MLLNFNPQPLFQYESIDEIDEIDNDLKIQATVFYEVFGANYTLTILQERKHQYAQVILSGLFHKIMTSSTDSTTDFQIYDALFDSFDDISRKLIYISGHIKFNLLYPIVKKKVQQFIFLQLIVWIVDQLTIKHGSKPAIALNDTYVYLIRQIRDRNSDARNIEFASQILQTIHTHMSWFKETTIPVIVFCLMRLIPFHQKHFKELFHLEIKIANKLIRQNFSECLVLGREFLRAIQDVSLLHDFESTWRDMIKTPERLSPNFTSIEDHFFKPTPINILCLRFNPAMEQKLYFILTGIPINVGWTFWSRFKKNFLSTPESEWLVPDIIRYICGLVIPREVVEHPNYIQKWQIIRNLLLSLRNEYVCQNAKLALFYDWIFYSPGDGHHRLEPAATLMKQCAKSSKHKNITGTLVEFLYLLVEEYAPNIRDLIRQRIKAAHSELLSKGIIRVITDYMFDDEQVRNYLEYLFSGATIRKYTTLNRSTDADASSQMRLSLAQNQGSIETSLETALEKACDPVIADNARIKHFSQYLVHYCEDAAKPNPEWLNHFQSKISSSLINLVNNNSDCSIAKSLITAIIEYDVPVEKGNHLRSFCILLYELNPLFGLALWFEIIRQISGEFHQRSRMMWFFKGLADHLSLTLEVYFEKCFTMLFDTSLPLFYKIVPIAFTYLPEFCSGNLVIVDLIVRLLDPFGLQFIYQNLLLGTYSLFGTEEDAIEIIETSLTWGTFEQISIWNLLQAECGDKEMAHAIISFTLQNIQVDVNPEAIIGILGLISQCKLDNMTLAAVFLCPDHLGQIFLAAMTKLYYLHGQVKIETILGSILKEYEQKEESNDNNSPMKLCLANMCKLKSYWNASETLQADFPEVPFSHIPVVGFILSKFRIESEFSDLMINYNSLNHGAPNQRARSQDGYISPQNPNTNDSMFFNHRQSSH